MTIKKNSLQSLIKKTVEERRVPSNVVMQHYFFEAFLKRLIKSQYALNFTFKGGFLLSCNLGIELRSTMDIDFLLNNINFQKDVIQNMFNQIISVKIDDYIKFKIQKIDDIRDNDEYGGFKVVLIGSLENIRVNVSIDVATGDPVTPQPVEYKYNCLLTNDFFILKSYNFETILAEKIQTILYRGLTNSRCKDFYDVYIIEKLRKKEINKDILFAAFKNTCEYRKTIFRKIECLNIIDSLNENEIILSRWKNFCNKNDFAIGIKFNEVIESLKKIIHIIFD